MKRYIVLLALLLLVSGCDLGKGNETVDEVSLGEGEEEQTEIVSEYQKESSFDEHGVWYEIFVRSFADGDDDGIGDFVGLTEKLDYLNDGAPGGQDLGIDGIWLMPMNPSPSYHGYDVTDYYDVNPDYGTMEEFETFIDEAHARGIKVIIDLVINHSSAQHPWFREALDDPSSPYRDYYTFVEKDAEGYNLDKQVWGHKVFNKAGNSYYYAIFWDQMPDLNYENQAVRDEVVKIARFWLDKGVDGFRMDAAMHIYGSGESPKGTSNKEKNIAWWEEFDGIIREDYPNYYLVGEIWTDTDKRADYATAFDSTFNFDFAEYGLVGMAMYGMDFESKNNGLVLAVEKQLTILDEVNDQFIDAIYLSNHDQKRVMTYLKGNMDNMKLLANIYLTLPGNPFLYYGEEIGMEGDKPDELIREPFVWSEEKYLTTWEMVQYNANTISAEEQLMDEESLLNHYREIIGLRKDNPALLSGAFEGIETTSNRIVAYRRYTEDQSLIVVHNLTDDVIELDLSEIADQQPSLYYTSNEGVLMGESVVEIPSKTTLLFE